jgi:AcrR family transcriptional regulator
MPGPTANPKNKHQERTEKTQAKILDAAQALFAEQGFERTQLEEVAARAGYTRGAIYAHFPSKEDLFLALMEHRVHTRFTAVCKAIEEEPDIRKRPAMFRDWVVSQISDSAWGTLTLEFKLYAMRNQRSREKLQRLYDLLFKESGKDFVASLFGDGLDKDMRKAIERRLALMGAVLSAIVLESHFRPELLPSKQLKGLVDEIFDSLVHA